MAPEYRVVSVLGLRVVGEALLDALHVLQSVPAAVLQTEFDRSRSSDRNPKFHKLISSTNKQSKDRDQTKKRRHFSVFLSVLSTTRTSHRVKDSIQLRDSIRTLRLWI
ncbi:unnamed protein product [Sphagnum jensenii]|uniref:Uncharacterized protein n=1 Tax=Sphagnum jensenii TaxID=128206 RepID=A0ABP1A5M1_9BRYO